MRLRSVVICCVTSGAILAGCAARPPLPVEAIAPNPFGYLRRSALCTLAPAQAIPGGHSVAMQTRSDDGLCAVTISQPDGGAYAAFLLGTLPAHGNSLIYNYNRQTVVTYTAATAYAGPDSFTVSLVPGPGQPRSILRVDVLADATGVAPPPAPAAPAAPAPGKPKPRRRHPGHHP